MAILLLCILCLPGGHLQAQVPASPLPAVLRSATPIGQAAAPAATTAPSPSPVPATRLRARSTDGNINVRVQPDLDSEVLGALKPDAEYEVLRRYFRWYEFRYSASPTGRGWVFGDLVEILGDEARIQAIDNAADIVVPVAPTEDFAAATIESGRNLQVATLEGRARIAAGAGTQNVLPTFTPPRATPVPFQQQLPALSAFDEDALQIPPIVPIAALGALGLLSLVLSAFRR